MSHCLVCEGSLAECLSFGRMPLANGFLRRDQFATEFFADLRVALCERCHMVQLVQPLERERLFTDQYPFFSSTSAAMNLHFRALAASIRARLEGPAPFVVEVGSNDGTFLSHFAAEGVRTLGIEPCANVAAAAAARGVPTIVRFFDAACGRDIRASEGPADAVVATNAFSHIPYLRSVLDGCDALLEDRGLVVFEEPYVADVLDANAYDQFYDEHAFYFSATAASAAVSMHGLELIDVEPQPVHGGSLVYVCGRTGRHTVSARVHALCAREQVRGLGALESYRRFARDVEQSRDRLLALLHGLHAEGRRVAGYAATSKSTTVLNYGQIGPALIEYIADSTPAKQGLFTPGMHIPVESPERFRADPPDYAVLFGWNHAREILAKEAAFAAGGGRWIRYVPEVAVSQPPHAGVPVFERC